MPNPSRTRRIGVLKRSGFRGSLVSRQRQNLRQAALGALARLVVLPELHLCGYDLPRLAHDPGDAIVRADRGQHVADPRLDPLAHTAVRHRITVLIGVAVRHHDGRLTNSVLAVRPSGIVTFPYDKQHLWHAEEAVLFSAGTRAAALTVDDWRLGLGICYRDYSQCTGLRPGGEANLRTALTSAMCMDPHCSPRPRSERPILLLDVLLHEAERCAAGRPGEV
ncbi:carbon-nitrogen hydrolase family protein [Streptomyces sp. NPDC086080]|uniref:carbon-nitrogen hydrolase family protein n=1 Tax=Streptomyces sp. NPDC086080 TaxID=3365748 RepID=UPI0037D01226